MDLHIFSSSDELFKVAAEDFILKSSKSIKEKGVCNIVLAGGNTPKKFFETVLKLASENKKIAWDKMRFFFGDERYVPADDPQSNYFTAQQFLFSKVPVLQQNIFRIPTELVNAAECAKQYEETLRKLFSLKDFQWPAFDITYLGMGDNGHTASLMPFTDFVSEYVQHPDVSPKIVASMWVEALKMFRITLTPPAINHSQHIIFLVEGESKASALKEVLEKRNNPVQYPALLIKNAVWFVDQAAASQLEK